MLLKSLTIVLLLAAVAVVADPSKWRKGKESENKEFNRKVEILFSIVFLFSYLFVLIKFFFFFLSSFLLFRTHSFSFTIHIHCCYFIAPPVYPAQFTVPIRQFIFSEGKSYPSQFVYYYDATKKLTTQAHGEGQMDFLCHSIAGKEIWGIWERTSL